MDFIDFKGNEPKEDGYYMTHYLHKSGEKFYKSLWWDGKEFKHLDYVVEIYKYIPDRFAFYVPCEYQDHSMENLAVWHKEGKLLDFKDHNAGMA